MKESAVERAVVKWAKDRGISTEKLSGLNSRGKADRLFMRKGKAVFCELKKPGETASPLQLKRLQERRDDGFSADWFDDSESAKAWLKKELL